MDTHEHDSRECRPAEIAHAQRPEMSIPSLASIIQKSRIENVFLSGNSIKVVSHSMDSVESRKTFRYIRKITSKA